MKADSSIPHLDAGFRIGCHCCRESFYQSGSKMPQLAKTASELGMYSRPGYRSWLAERMQPPSKPDVKVQRHGTVSKLPDGSLLERNWVVSQGFPEELVEDNALLPQTPL